MALWARARGLRNSSSPFLCYPLLLSQRFTSHGVNSRILLRASSRLLHCSPSARQDRSSEQSAHHEDPGGRVSCMKRALPNSPRASRGREISLKNKNLTLNSPLISRSDASADARSRSRCSKVGDELVSAARRLIMYPDYEFLLTLIGCYKAFIDSSKPKRSTAYLRWSRQKRDEYERELQEIISNYPSHSLCPLLQENSTSPPN